MTKEEKLQAYDEALKRVRPLYQQAKMDNNPIASTYEYLFPELAESKDERIRKTLIGYFEWVKERDCKSEWNGLKVDDIRAYLEKQRENIWSEEDDAKVKAMCEEGYLKPSERAWLKDLSNRVWKDQKLAEWSEEDENKLNHILEIVHIASGSEASVNEKEELESFLKSLRPQPRVKTNDYITPHKKFFEWIYNRLIDVHNEDPNVDYMQSFRKRIDNLQFDEPQWKPSEEQMNALLYAMSFVSPATKESVLLSEIYENLKNCNQ